MSKMDDLVKRIEALEPAPDEPAWASLHLVEVVVPDGKNADNILHGLYFEIETLFENIVDAIEQHFGEADPDLSEDASPELVDGLKEQTFWRLADESLLVLGWLHETNEEPIEILAVRSFE